MVRTSQKARRPASAAAVTTTTSVSLSKENKHEQHLAKNNAMRAEVKYLERRYDGKGVLFVAEQKEPKQAKEKIDWWQKFVLCVTRQLDRQNKVGIS